MREKRWVLRKFLFIAVIMVVLAGIGLRNYLLFHSLVEIYSISIAFTLFMVAWNARDFNPHSYIVLVGTAYLFVGVLDLFHTLAYKGMDIFSADPYAASQLWVAARLMESVSLLGAFAAVGRERWRLSYETIFVGYFLVTGFTLAAVFIYEVFPVCFVEGVGQTPFKIGAEVLVVLFVFAAWRALKKNRKHLGEAVYPLLAGSLALTVASEASFMVYVDVYGVSNMVGHFFKLLSFYLIYKAAIDLGLRTPYAVIFRELKEKETLLKSVALVDLETGLFNRNAYDRVKEKLWVIAQKSRTPMAIGLLSIADYEKTGENYGEASVRGLLDILIEITRETLSEDHFFFRMKENEFLILFGEDEANVKDVMETIVERFEDKTRAVQGRRIGLDRGVSEQGGLVSYSLEDLYESAGEDLSRNKLRRTVRSLA